MTKGTTLSFPTGEFRSLPVPGFVEGKTRAKLATCFVACEDLPEKLEDWMGVNPRVPRLDKRDRLKGPVARAIVSTLTDEPTLFALKNQGIWLIADEVLGGQKSEGGNGSVQVKLTDPSRHGLVNGGHTFQAIQQVKAERVESGQDDEWPAYVRLHILTGVDGGEFDISELAEGLNRSMQVDDPSLRNLQGRFKGIQDALKGKRGGDKIEYRQGEEGELDVVTVLLMMAVFDLTKYPDRKAIPNGLFGHGKVVLERFVNDEDGSFAKIVPRVHDILVLSERIQQEAVPHVNRVKIADHKDKEKNRVASPKNKRDAVFAKGTIGGKIPWGWLYPMLAAFRANVSREAWAKGKFEWLADPDTVLEKVIEEMSEVVYRENKENKDKPAEVGRKESAYRLCYGIAQMELAGRGLPVT